MVDLIYTDLSKANHGPLLEKLNAAGVFSLMKWICPNLIEAATFFTVDICLANIRFLPKG